MIYRLVWVKTKMKMIMLHSGGHTWDEEREEKENYKFSFPRNGNDNN